MEAERVPLQFRFLEYASRGLYKSQLVQIVLGRVISSFVSNYNSVYGHTVVWSYDG
jgi:hypothetical protein